MPGDDALGIVDEIWEIVKRNPGLAFIIFVILFFVFLIVFFRIGVATPWTLVLAFVIAVFGTALILLELRNRGFLSAAIVMTEAIKELRSLWKAKI